MKLHTCLPRCLYAATCLFIVLSSTKTACSQPRATRLSLQEVVDGMQRSYDRFLKLPSVSLRYSLTYTHEAGTRRFGFNNVNVVSLRQGDMLRTELEGRTLEDLPVARVCTWNGNVGTNIISESADISISRKPDALIFYYRYYTDCLFFPEGSGQLPDGVGALTPQDEDYWLPHALTSHFDEYRIRPDTETIDGFECHVVARAGHDTIWIDTQNGFLVRRRDFFHPDSTVLRERTYSQDAEEIQGFWWPRTIVREEFCRFDEDEKLHNKVCGRKVIELNDLSFDVLPTDQFLLPINPGVTVHDRVRGLAYTTYPEDIDPLNEMLVSARPAMLPQRRSLRLLGLIVPLGLANILLLLSCIRLRRP